MNRFKVKKTRTHYELACQCGCPAVLIIDKKPVKGDWALRLHNSNTQEQPSIKLPAKLVGLWIAAALDEKNGE